MATNFLWAPGTSNNGLLTSAFNLMTTEMNSLASNGTATSSVGGTSGLFTNSNTAQGILSELFLTLGAIGTAVVAGGGVAGWFLVTPDGSTFENTVSGNALARPADFFIPLPQTTITAGWVYKSAGAVILPTLKFKVFVQNVSGQAMAATGNTIVAAPYAVQY